MTPAAGKGVPRRSGRVLLPALSLVIVLGTWEAAVHVFGLSPLLLPPPSAIGPALWDGLVAGRWWDDIWVTTIETVLGFAIGAVIGLILGGLISEVELFRHVVYPYVVAIQSVPKLAIAPLLVIWLGFGLSSKVALVALVVLFPVAVNTAEGLQSTSAGRMEMLRLFGASRWQVFRMARVPTALPFIFAGFDVAAVLAVLGAVVAEWVGAKSGLGNLVLNLTYNLNVSAMFAVLTVMAVMGVAAHLVVQFIQRRVVFWRET